MTGDRWPNPQQQMTCSFTEVHFSVTCEILDEHTDCSRCTSCVGPRWRVDRAHYKLDSTEVVREWGGVYTRAEEKQSF